ncbi:MAG: ABC transporter permease [Cytophagales bacterium]|nr:ABC transporter permease [Armatimonadota bacterium]
MNELLAAAIRQWVPLAFAATGGVVSERSGVVNIALEGMMLAGAFASVSAASATGNTLLGLLAGLLAGALVGLLHAVITQALRVPHILSGVGINLGMLGLTTYALRLYEGGGLESAATLSYPVMAAAAALAVGLTTLVLARTPLGLRLRACGENPGAARTAGVSVTRVRYGAVVASGALAGLGGVALALTTLGVFTENMTAGRGYVALAAVIFGRWNPLGAAATAFFFALGDAVQIALQTAGLGGRIPPDFLSLLPYVLTLIALGTIRSRNIAPAALGDPSV